MALRKDGMVATSSGVFNKSAIQNQLRFQAMYSIISRLKMARGLGQSYSGERDLYEAFGYPKTLEFEDYWWLYKRGDISPRIVDAAPDASWRIPPKIMEDKDNTTETEFESSWISLQKKIHIWHHLHQVDVLSGIGQYAILLLGFNDGSDLSRPINSGRSNLELIYLKAYKQDMAKVAKLDENITSPRYGLPETYKLRLGVQLEDAEALTQQREVELHHSRVLHVAENLVDNRIYGTPRLEKPYNRLSNMELIAGSSAEMWYRGAFPGYNFKMDPEAQIPPDMLSDMKDQIEEYMHDFKRYLRLQGVDVESITPQVSDPSSAVDVQLKLISACTGIPARILLGSERGELASDQDEKNWLDKIYARRTNYCEPFILRPFIGKLIEYGIIPEVDDYHIRWPELIDSSELDKASSMERRTAAITKYSDSPAAQHIFPPAYFFTKIMDMDEEDAQQIIRDVEDYVEEEEEQIRRDRELMEREREARINQPQGGGNEE